MALRCIPCTIKAAKAFVADHHRHHAPPQGALFALALHDGARVVGVVIVGRPVARALQDGFTAEVTRLCTDGSRNACSMLYSRARRAAFALGYRKLITYTLPSEGGASLRASGWTNEGAAGGGRWGCPSRPRSGTSPTERKQRWSVAA